MHSLNILVTFMVELIAGPSTKTFLVTSPNRDGVRAINDHIGRTIAYIDACGMVKIINGRSFVRRDVDTNDSSDHLWGALVALKVVKATNYASVYGATDISGVRLSQYGKTYTEGTVVHSGAGDVGATNPPRYRTPTQSAT